MARNAPGAIRAPQSRPAQKVRLVDGLPGRANAEVLQLQRRRPDLSVVESLATYRREIRRPGRWLRLLENDCPCPACDVTHHRDVLEAAMHALPGPAARELRRIVDALDDEFLRKTLPDPHAPPDLPWWHRRVEDR